MSKELFTTKPVTSYIETIQNIIVVTKSVRLSSDLPEFDEDFYTWKRNYWKSKIKDIKYVVAPMVDQSLFVKDFTYRKTAFSTIPEDRPLIIQFCANDTLTFLNACRLVEGFCDGVDLNLGCPQVIAKRGRYGAFLQVFKHCRLPLSVKIRILNNEEDTIKYAKMIQNAGASMLCVHGRVREQRGVHTGLADWACIKRIKEELDIPIIANGNIQMGIDVSKCLESTNADGCMSAEGILSNPFLFENKNLFNFTIAEEYLQYARKYKASVSAIRAHLFRICHYSLLKYSDLRQRNSYVSNVEQFQGVVDDLAERCKKEMLEENLATKTWDEFVETINATPHWFSKPYVRPVTNNDSQESYDKTLSTNAYREERRAELERMVVETGLSKRRIRKREVLLNELLLKFLAS